MNNNILIFSEYTELNNGETQIEIELMNIIVIKQILKETH